MKCIFKYREVKIKLDIVQEKSKMVQLGSQRAIADHQNLKSKSRSAHGMAGVAISAPERRTALLTVFEHAKCLLSAASSSKMLVLKMGTT